jgi:hypothetical protein
MTPGTLVRRKHGINTRLTLLADDFSYEEPSTTKHFNRKRVLQDQRSTLLSDGASIFKGSLNRCEAIHRTSTELTPQPIK